MLFNYHFLSYRSHRFSPSYFKLCFVPNYNRQAICSSRTAFGTRQYTVRETIRPRASRWLWRCEIAKFSRTNRVHGVGRTERGWVTRRRRRRRETWREKKKRKRRWRWRKERPTQPAMIDSSEQRRSRLSSRGIGTMGGLKIVIPNGMSLWYGT